MNILFVNGPNLGELGRREPEVYGELSLDALLDTAEQTVRPFASDLSCVRFSANGEGDIIDRLYRRDYDALVINPGAYAHYSLALADCLRAIDVPKVEVHLTNLWQREPMRQMLVTAGAVDCLLAGAGGDAYLLGLLWALRALGWQLTPEGV